MQFVYVVVNYKGAVVVICDTEETAQRFTLNHGDTIARMPIIERP